MLWYLNYNTKNCDDALWMKVFLNVQFKHGSLMHGYFIYCISSSPVSNGNAMCTAQRFDAWIICFINIDAMKREFLNTVKIALYLVTKFQAKSLSVHYSQGTLNYLLWLLNVQHKKDFLCVAPQPKVLVLRFKTQDSGK